MDLGSAPATPCASAPDHTASAASTPFHTPPTSPSISAQGSTTSNQTIPPLQLSPPPATSRPKNAVEQWLKQIEERLSWVQPWSRRAIKILGFFICVAGLYLGVASYLETRQSNILARQGNDIVAWQSQKEFYQYCEEKFAMQPEHMSAECVDATKNYVVNAPPTPVLLTRSLSGRPPLHSAFPDSTMFLLKKWFSCWTRLHTFSRSMFTRVKGAVMKLAQLGIRGLALSLCIYVFYLTRRSLAALFACQNACLIIYRVYLRHMSLPGIWTGSLLLISTDITGYVLWRLLFRPQFSVLRDLPQPSTRGGLLTGHVGAIFSIPLGRQVAEWVNCIPNNGLLWFRGILGAEYLIVAGAEGLRDVLFTRTYDFEKPSAFRRYTRRFLASGIVVQEGHAHKAQRRAISPVFQPRNVDALKPMLSQKSMRLVQILHAQSHVQASYSQGFMQSRGGTVIDICDWATRFAFDIACVISFGDDWGLVEDSKVTPILSAYKTIFTGSKTRMSHFIWHNTVPQWLTKAFPHKLDHAIDEAATAIRQVSKQAVTDRIDLITRGEKEPPRDFLTEIIQSGKVATDEISGELLTSAAAAIEGTAGLIAMTIYQLTQNPTLQVQLREELSMFGLEAGESSIPEAQYEQSTLLNAVLNEMMRLEPPLPITLRKTICNTSVGGHPVQAGTYIVISPYAMGRSEDIWGPTAACFNPHRWINPPSSDYPSTSPLGTLNEHGGAANYYGMLTFLKGPKGCTGERFAKAELRRVIAALVVNFAWELEQTHQPEQAGFVFVKPGNGIAVRYSPVLPISRDKQG